MLVELRCFLWLCSLSFTAFFAMLVKLCFFDFVELLGGDSDLCDAHALSLGEAVVRTGRISEGDDVAALVEAEVRVDRIGC